MSFQYVAVEKPDIIKFYAFTFEDIEKPVIIEAFTANEAREGLLKVIERLPDKFQGKKVVGQTVTLPVVGVSQKKINGVNYIWGGKKRSPNGWLTEEQFKQLKRR